MKKTQELPDSLANENLANAFTVLEDVMLADVRELERMSNDIKILQLKLKKLVFKFSDGEVAIDTNTDARIGFDFKRKSIFYKAHPTSSNISLVSAPVKAKKEVYAYLPQLIMDLKEEYVYRKELEAVG